MFFNLIEIRSTSHILAMDKIFSYHEHIGRTRTGAAAFMRQANVLRLVANRTLIRSLPLAAYQGCYGVLL